MTALQKAAKLPRSRFHNYSTLHITEKVLCALSVDKQVVVSEDVAYGHPTVFLNRELKERQQFGCVNAGVAAFGSGVAVFHL